MLKSVRLATARWGRGFSRLNFRRAVECDVVLRWLEPAPGERILDVGCGDGYYDWRVSRSGAHVTGIDVHEKRLAFARRHYGNDRTQFLFMDAERMDLPPGSFDKALSLCVMEHLGDDQRVMQNISQALKPGGRFAFSADSLSNPGIMPEERERHRRRYAVNTFYTEEVVRRKLDRAGFELEAVEYVLATSGDLRLVRLSWKFDHLIPALIPARFLGYLLLGAVYRLSSASRHRLPEAAKTGLTLIVRARKRSG
ncbi:MAG: class I SAM-dependent methyltransferase [Candidatus Aminicenantales bacterium]